MPFTFHVLKDLLSTVALMALLAVAYGTVTRSFTQAATGQAVLGALFGGVAVLAILDPLHVAEGVIVDLRSVPVVLAGAFLGLPGVAVAALMALSLRVGIGGLGVVAGSASVIVSALVGLAWAGLVRRLPDQRVLNLLLLATLSQTQLVTYFLLPWDLAWLSVTTIWPVIVPIKFAGVLVVGALLMRERIIANEAKQLGLAAMRDPLTGLLNRRGFEAAVARLPAKGGGLALLVLDLDHFKRVNDTHGHTAGDAVLQSLAGRLRDALEPGAVVARFGGEEVVVFLPDLKPRAAMDVAERLCEVMRGQPFILPNGRQAVVTASVGGVWTNMIWTSGRVGLDALMTRADIALYAAKEAGRNCWRLDIGGRLADKSARPARAAGQRRIAA